MAPPRLGRLLGQADKAIVDHLTAAHGAEKAARLVSGQPGWPTPLYAEFYLHLRSLCQQHRAVLHEAGLLATADVWDRRDEMRALLAEEGFGWIYTVLFIALRQAWQFEILAQHWRDATLDLERWFYQAGEAVRRQLVAELHTLIADCADLVAGKGQLTPWADAPQAA